MPDPNLITQLAEALPEGTEVPNGWRRSSLESDTLKLGQWFWHWRDSAGTSHMRLLDKANDDDLAAFTYAAEGVLYKSRAKELPIEGSIEMNADGTWDWWVTHEPGGVTKDLGTAPSRPAAALAALRAMKEEK